MSVRHSNLLTIIDSIGKDGATSIDISNTLGMANRNSVSNYIRELMASSIISDTGRKHIVSPTSGRNIPFSVYTIIAPPEQVERYKLGLAAGMKLKTFSEASPIYVERPAIPKIIGRRDPLVAALFGEARA